MRRKLRDFVQFPIEGLDLSRIMATDPDKRQAAEIDVSPGAEAESKKSEKSKGGSKKKSKKSKGESKRPKALNGDAPTEIAGTKEAAEAKGTVSETDVPTENGGDDSSSSRLNDDNGRGEMLYDLYGVVHHQGAMSGGHYVASLKSDDGQWRLFNDAQIYEIHSRDVVDSSAYILFYIRRDVKDLKLEDFWNISPAKDGEGLTEEEVDKLIQGRSERCVIS